MQVVKIMWLKMLDYAFVSKRFFFLAKKIKKGYCLSWWKKTNFFCVLSLAKCYYATTSFALWIPNAHDIFAFVI